MSVVISDYIIFLNMVLFNEGPFTHLYTVVLMILAEWVFLCHIIPKFV